MSGQTVPTDVTEFFLQPLPKVQPEVQYWEAFISRVKCLIGSVDNDPQGRETLILLRDLIVSGNTGDALRAQALVTMVSRDHLQRMLQFTRTGGRYCIEACPMLEAELARR